MRQQHDRSFQVSSVAPIIIVTDMHFGPQLHLGLAPHAVHHHLNDLWVQAADLAQLPVRGARFSSPSSVSTLFDILAHPPPEFGFSYQWRNLSVAATQNQTDLSIDGSVPCCVPMSPAIQARVLSKYNYTVSGGRMGSCNLNSGDATFLYNDASNATSLTLSLADGSSSAQVLVMDQSAAIRSPSAPAPSQSSEP